MNLFKNLDNNQNNQKIIYNQEYQNYYQFQNNQQKKQNIENIVENEEIQDEKNKEEMKEVQQMKKELLEVEEEENEEEENEEEEDNNLEKKVLIKIEEDNKKKKCSLNEHSEIDAIKYCLECKIYMCNKCEKVHSSLLKNHHLSSLDKNINDIFTGICKEKNHLMKLEYFCKTHNQLCCAACIAKIRCRGNGKHKSCKVLYINKIKNKKKNGLEKNIKHLEELSNRIQESINELKKIYESINENKENLKIKIQKIFTKIRNSLNDREEKLLL